VSERVSAVFDLLPESQQIDNSVCNANMDGRDVVCVMPTGKAMIWDVPQLLMPSCRGRKIFDLSTACTPDTRLYIGDISPHFLDDGSDSASERGGRHVSFYLMFYLFNAVTLKVEAVMLTGGTPRHLLNEIQQRLTSMASSPVHGHQGRDIKLCYVTVIQWLKDILTLIHFAARENS
jgi:ATP-dependent DNA helicase Q1